MVVATAVAGFFAAAPGAQAANPACPDADSSAVGSCTFSTAGFETFTVPDGVTKLDVLAVGAAGGTGFSGGAPVSGGRGASVEDVGVSVPPGQRLVAIVGGIGAGGIQTNGGAGGTPGGGGAAGDYPGGNSLANGDGGGGGGYSGVLRASGQPLVIAGGGGGGGGFGGAGGDAGAPGADGVNQTSPGAGGGAGTTSGGGAGGAAGANSGSGSGAAGAFLAGGAGGTSVTSFNSSGGGGGGGYFGGGGGGGGFVGGGGGGGSNFGVAPGLVNQPATSAPASVWIFYSIPVVTIQTTTSPNAAGWFTTTPVTGTASITETGEQAATNITTVSCTEDGAQLALNVTGLGTESASADFAVSDLGAHSVSCTATDANTNSGSGSAAVKIETSPPQVSISSPTNTTYYVGQTVTPSYSCSAANASDPGVASCTDSGGGSSASPGAVDTSSAGDRSYTVTATSSDGLSTPKTVDYTVALRPVAVGVSCAPRTIAVGQRAACTATVSDSVGTETPTGSVHLNSSDSSDSLPESCALEATSTAGKSSCSFPYSASDVGASPRTITAAYAANNVFAASSNTASERVGSAHAPRAVIVSPKAGGTYKLGQVVRTSFACHDASGEPGIASCLDSNGASSGHGKLNTSSPGAHTYKVFATSKDGRTVQVVLHYRVAGRPTVTISAPKNKATYTKGQRALARYSCRDGQAGPGISSCVGTVASGRPINTRTTGAHTFTVTALSKDGQKTVKTVRYTVS